MRSFSRRGLGRMAMAAVAAGVALSVSGAVTTHADSGPGAVYTLSNEAAGNRVQEWRRAADGSLAPGRIYATGGLGAGSGLGSQGALILSENHRFLFAVNAGSNDISSFAVRNSGLVLVDRVSSGGVRPTSLTIAGNLLYVLNAGTPNSISGFTVDARGGLTPLANSTRALSAAQTTPSQVQFSPDGRVLVVTERGTNLVSTFAVERDGRPGFVQTAPSGGPAPFGFAFDQRGRFFVSEAANSTLSSYDVNRAGQVTPLSSAVANGQRAACWVVVTENGRYAYTANAQTHNISGYRINHDGTVALLSADGITADTVGNPTDMALSAGSGYLYALTPNTREIHAFRVHPDGSLSAVPGASGLVMGSVGLAAR